MSWPSWPHCCVLPPEPSTPAEPGRWEPEERGRQDWTDETAPGLLFLQPHLLSLQGNLKVLACVALGALPLPLFCHHYWRRRCHRHYCPSIRPRSLKRSPQTESYLCSQTHNFCSLTYHRHHVTRTYAIGCQLCLFAYSLDDSKGRDLGEPWELKFEPREGVRRNVKDPPLKALGGVRILRGLDGFSLALQRRWFIPKEEWIWATAVQRYRSRCLDWLHRKCFFNFNPSILLLAKTKTF